MGVQVTTLDLIMADGRLDQDSGRDFCLAKPDQTQLGCGGCWKIAQ
jgi:hypothetical protein